MKKLMLTFEKQGDARAAFIKTRAHADVKMAPALGANDDGSGFALYADFACLGQVSSLLCGMRGIRYYAVTEKGGKITPEQIN